jgi:hypothetical protein
MAVIRGSRVGSTASRSAWLIVFLLAACQATSVASPVAPSLAVAAPSATAVPSASAVPTTAATPVPLPSALPRPTDISTDGTCESPYTCLGLLSAGVHHTAVFRPGFAFTMPGPGWENPADEGGAFALLPIDSPGDTIDFFRQPKATAPDGTAVFSVDISVDAIKKWLATNAALSVGPAKTVSIGGLTGVQMDIAVSPNAAPTPGCPVQTCVSIFRGVDPATVKTWEWDWQTVTAERQRLSLLTTADGGVIAILVDSLDGTTYDSLIKTADTILATVKFDAP